MYRIKHSVLNLYSKGGAYVNDNTYDMNGKTRYFSWSKNGKAYSSIGGIKKHLRQYFNYPLIDNNRSKGYDYSAGKINQIPEEWIIEELTAEGLKTYSAKELMTEI